MSVEVDENTEHNFFVRYKNLLLSVILSVYSLPVSFYDVPNSELDGSWTRAINMAVRNNLVFGTQFVFTYGPLGFLSTRYGQYIPGVLLFFGDVFLAAGIFHLAHRYLTRSRGWFFILLIALVYFRGGNYAQSLFLLFVAYTSLGFKNNFSNLFETVYSALSGVLLFFIKINFGIVAMILLPLVAVWLLLKNRRSFVFFATSAVTLFVFIFFCVHIDLASYVRNGLLLIQYYDESMYLAIVPGEKYFLFGLLLIAVFAGLLICRVFRLWKQRNYPAGIIAPVLLLSLTCFLFYKNGYTRYDGEHHGYFFSVFPLLLIFTLFLLDFERFLPARLTGILAIVLSGMCYMQPRLASKVFNWEGLNSYISPAHYFAGIFDGYNEHIPEVMLFDEAKQASLVDSTIDIFPTQIAWLQFNSLNYKGRPVPQSYSVYCGALDLLNASFYLKKDRPELVLMGDKTIDDRYAFWDESLTKATICLNYREDEIFNEDWALRYSFPKMLLLKSIGGSHQQPRFEKLASVTTSIGDTVRFNFPDSIPVYMTADIRYNFAGTLSKIFFQPSPISVTLLMEDESKLTNLAVRPILASLVLINKAVLNNVDLRNFFSRKLEKNKNIRGFVFSANKGMFEKKIEITYYRFSNY